jgi:hypothetical protein
MLGASKTDVVLAALQEKIDREAKPVSVLEKLEKLWAAHPAPPPTGKLPIRRSLTNDLANMNGNNLPETANGEAHGPRGPAQVSAGLSFRVRLADWRQRHPMPAPTGTIADKAFFDELSGDL